MRGLAWLDAVDEEIERALTAAVRELIQELQRLKAAQKEGVK